MLTRCILDKNDEEQLIGPILSTKLQKKGAFFEETPIISSKKC